MSKAKKKLTVQERLFVAEYVVSRNAGKAARNAGYANSSATKLAPGWVCETGKCTKPHVKAEVRKRIAKIENKLELKAEDVLRELMKIGFSNIQDYIGEDNAIVDISKIPRDIAAAVESIQTDVRHDSGDSEGYTEKIKFKLNDKRGALVDLARHLGLFKEDNVHRIEFGDVIVK